MVGVAESVAAASAVADTLTVSFVPATLSAKCNTGCEPDTTITFCLVCSKPVAATVTTYSPSGTAGKTKLPFASEFVVADQSDAFALIITIASDTGRCCGSWMMPRTEPTTAADAAMASIKNVANSVVRMKRMPLSTGGLTGATEVALLPVPFQFLEFWGLRRWRKTEEHAWTARRRI